jgi:hypothetical protein
MHVTSAAATLNDNVIIREASSGFASESTLPTQALSAEKSLFAGEMVNGWKTGRVSVAQQSSE